MAKQKSYRWVVWAVAHTVDTLLLVFLLYMGITKGLFNWGPDWWYSVLTLVVFLIGGYIPKSYMRYLTGEST